MLTILLILTSASLLRPHTSSAHRRKAQNNLTTETPCPVQEPLVQILPHINNEKQWRFCNKKKQKKGRTQSDNGLVLIKPAASRFTGVAGSKRCSNCAPPRQSRAVFRLPHGHLSVCGCVVSKTIVHVIIYFFRWNRVF